MVIRRCSASAQRGYILLSLTLALALVLIALSAGIPTITAQLRRQREDELIHRGVQYTRAIRSYYRTHGTYPTGLDQLEPNGERRFLRRRYLDPMTGGEFRLVHVGEVQLLPRQAIYEPAQNGSTPEEKTASASTSPAGSGSATEFEGGPVMGVASTSTKSSFRVFDNKTRYSDWNFVYSPLLDLGGLFARPYDGIPAVGNAGVATPTAPTIQTPQGRGAGPAPGVPVPGVPRP